MRTRRSWRNQERLWQELGRDHGVEGPTVQRGTPGFAAALACAPVVSLDPLQRAEHALQCYTSQPFANPRTVNQLRADVNRARIKQARRIALAKGVTS